MLKLKHKLSLYFVLFTGLAGLTQFALVPATVSAATSLPTVFAAEDIGETTNLQGDCKGADLSKDCAIVGYLVTFIKVLSGLVGVVVVIMITVGGIQYSSARDNPQAMAAAKGRITNAIIALVAYLFMFAFLQYIVPGGVIR